MSDERLVAVVSPWEKIAEIAKQQFRLESLPAEKKVMVWRDDLRSEEQLTQELQKFGITVIEVRKKRIIDWENVP